MGWLKLAVLGVFVSLSLTLAACGANSQAGGVHGQDQASSAKVKGSAKSRASQPEVDHSGAVVPVSAADPQWGSSLAPVTIVEFGDFQCPFCHLVTETLDRVRELYGPERVRIVWKHNPLPFHAQARPAQQLACAVFALKGNSAFWQFHNLALANHRQLTPENLQAWTKALGVNPRQVQTGPVAADCASKLDADIALAAKLGATGTPAFRINGVTLSGAQPFDEFQRIINEQLAAADALRQAGVEASKVYLVLSERNLEEPPPAKETPETPDEDKTVWRVPIESDDPVRGAKTPLVTIVEFGDFQCPFCKRVMPTLERVLKAYPEDVRLVWKDQPLPFHTQAKPAATLARLAYQRQGAPGFWKAHSALFESAPALEDEQLQGIANTLGLSWPAAKNAIEKHQFAAKFEQSEALASDLNARGVPHFFINGVRLAGSQSFEKFQTVIEEQLTKARSLEARGISRNAIYDEIMRDARTPPPPDRVEVPPPDVNSPVRGPRQAPVMIQLWSDFECPFCKRVTPTLAEIERLYGRRVKIVWRHLPLPFHKNAELAAEAAQEVFRQKGNPGFWAFHDKLFEAQAQPGGLERTNLEAIAASLSVNMTKFRAALDTHQHLPKLSADKAAAETAGINGTPTAVINGYLVSGAQPLTRFKKVIDLALSETQKR